MSFLPQAFAFALVVAIGLRPALFGTLVRAALIAYGLGLAPAG
jgi:hypothetical protein